MEEIIKAISQGLQEIPALSHELNDHIYHALAPDEEIDHYLVWVFSSPFNEIPDSDGKVVSVFFEVHVWGRLEDESLVVRLQDAVRSGLGGRIRLLLDDWTQVSLLFRSGHTERIASQFQSVGEYLLTVC